MFSSSSTTIIYNIVNTMGWIAGIACAGMIVMAVIKIITGDESDTKVYLRRIKNGIIAFVLIFSVTTITRLVVNSYLGTDKANIGDFSSHAIQISKDALSDDGKDVQMRQIIEYNNQKLVRTDVDWTLKKGSFFHKIKIKVDVYKAYNDCQGATKGWTAEKLYYVYKTSDDVDSDVNSKSKYYIFSKQDGDSIDGSKESWDNIVGNYNFETYDQETGNKYLFTVLTDQSGNLNLDSTNAYKDNK